MRSYWLPVLLSLFGHAVLVVAIAWGWEFAPKEKKVAPPNYVKATLVDFKASGKPKTTNKTIKKNEEKKAPPKKIDLTKQRQEQERLKKLASAKKKKDAEAAEKRKQAELEAQKKLVAEKAKREQERKRKAEQEKQKKLAAEKARKEKLEKERLAKEKQEAEQKRLAEIERQKEQQRLRDEQRKERERQNLLADLQRERTQLSQQAEQERLAQQAQEDEVLTASYSQLIARRVTNAWSRPPSARNDMSVKLIVQLVPTGEITDVVISESSGNAAFDRSALRAVNKAERFPEIRDMPSRLFEREFRRFTFNFSPQDLRQ